MKTAMISQPMAGKTHNEIKETRELAKNDLEQYGYTVADSLLYTPIETCKHKSLRCLAESLSIMSKCDTVYFCKGWKKARGCKIEHDVAKAYGLEIIYEEDKA